MSRCVRCFTLALALLALPSGAGAARSPARIGREHVPLPTVRQETEYTCAVATTRSVLSHFSVPIRSERAHARRMGTNERTGTDAQRIVKELSSHGLDATLHTGMSLATLESHVRQGRAVIVGYQAWATSPSEQTGYAKGWANGHYSAVVGMDRRHVYLMDPSMPHARGKLTRAEFEARWHNQTDQDQTRLDRLGIVVDGDRGAVRRERLGRFEPIP